MVLKNDRGPFHLWRYMARNGKNDIQKIQIMKKTVEKIYIFLKTKNS